MGSVGVLAALFCRIGRHCWNSRPARSSFLHVFTLQIIVRPFIRSATCILALICPRALCHIRSPHHSSPIHLRSISVFLTVILELGYESMKCDLCEALDSGAMRDVGWGVFPHPPSSSPPPLLPLPPCPEDAWNWAEWLHSSFYKLLSICST